MNQYNLRLMADVDSDLVTENEIEDALRAMLEKHPPGTLVAILLVARVAHIEQAPIVYDPPLYVEPPRRGRKPKARLESPPPAAE